MTSLRADDNDQLTEASFMVVEAASCPHVNYVVGATALYCCLIRL